MRDGTIEKCTACGAFYIERGSGMFLEYPELLQCPACVQDGENLVQELKEREIGT